MHLNTKLEQKNKESFICKNNCSIGASQPKQQSQEKQRKRQKQEPPPGPSKTAARRQLAAVSTARCHRLAIKQAKMATARRYITGHPKIAVNEHKISRKTNYNGSPKSKHEFITTNSNGNNDYQGKAKP